MTGLGIIDADLCLWAGGATPEMVEEAILVPGHPVIKAKPAPVAPVSSERDWLTRFNCWVAEHPLLAAALLAGGYLIARRAK